MKFLEIAFSGADQPSALTRQLRDKLRAATLAALDKAIIKITGINYPEGSNPAWKDSDLPWILPAIDAQVDRVIARLRNENQYGSNEFRVEDDAVGRENSRENGYPCDSKTRFWCVATKAERK